MLGRRFWAAMVDGLMLGVVFGFLSVITHGTRAQPLYGPRGYPVTTHTAAISGTTVLVFGALSLGYYFVLESMLGQTMGKMMLGIQVVDLDGHAASTPQVMVRTLGRMVDGLPFFFIVGFITPAPPEPSRHFRPGR
ncbi:MAG: RDD family protein [Solirubrobacteraceae bacterium]